MDRRTILFVVSLSLVLMLINGYFDRQRQNEIRHRREQQVQTELLAQQKLQESIQRRTVSIAQIPLFEVYADPEAQQRLGVVVKSGRLFFTAEAPVQSQQKIYIKQKDGTLTEVVRTKQAEKWDNLVGIYSSNADYKLPKVASLTSVGLFDLHLVSFPEATDMNQSVSLAEYRDGKFQLLGPQLNADAIAFLQVNGEFLPVGLYQIKEQTFRLFPQVLKGGNGNISAFDRPEEYYVLENDYVQLVFSNKGGALTEVNLPLMDKKNKNSLVREIEFDRKIAQQSPSNAQFPLYPAQRGEQLKIEGESTGQYYPLLRRDLKTAQGNVNRISARYYGLNIVSKYPEVAELSYHVKSFDKSHITFEAVQPYRRITKTFILNDQQQNAPYCFEVKIKVEGDSRNLWLTSGVPEVEWMTGAPSPVLKYRASIGRKSEVRKIDLPNQDIESSSFQPDWICNSNGFLGLIIDPLTKNAPGYKVEYVPGEHAASRLTLLESQYSQFNMKGLPGYNVMLPLQPDHSGELHFRVYAGPLAEEPLKAADAFFKDPKTGESHSYISTQEYHGWFAFLTYPIAKVLFFLMKGFHYLTHSWAISIILLTLVLRVVLYPLNTWSMRSMQKMKFISPKIAEIQERYKKDPQKAQMEVIQLYRKEKVNPFGGCLPILIQMPFLFSMFDLLKSSFELRGAGFIPGWIDNLTAPDVLFEWGTPLIFFGSQFHLLPFMLGGVMWLQQKMSSALPTTGGSEQQRQQQAVMSLMTIVFTFMFYNFPSGLNIYWLSSMLLGIAQQWWIKRKMEGQPVVII
ncbi:MAG: yidC [Chlamydiales bacterium]|jgi:YidC/Oxa1 family membrane protein insertase|nr:yidC [Chlamydiales bacterium]